MPKIPKPTFVPKALLPVRTVVGLPTSAASQPHHTVGPACRTMPHMPAACRTMSLQAARPPCLLSRTASTWATQNCLHLAQVSSQHSTMSQPPAPCMASGPQASCYLVQLHPHHVRLAATTQCSSLLPSSVPRATTMRLVQTMRPTPRPATTPRSAQIFKPASCANAS